MYVVVVSAKIAKDIPKRIFPKMSRNKSFYFIARFEAIYSASKTRILVLKYTTIGNRLLIYEFVNIGACLETSIWWLVLRQSNSFQNPKAISQLNFERLSNLTIFVGFIWLKFQSKMSANVFTRRAFLLTVSSTQSLSS